MDGSQVFSLSLFHRISPQKGGRLMRSMFSSPCFLVAALLLLLSNPALGAREKHEKEYYGKLIGNFNSYAHRVGGKVYAVDEDTLFIKGFTYDGLGPDAYFWMGKTSQPAPMGVIVPYPVEYSGEKRDPPVLKNYDSQDILLHLPDGFKIKDFKWLSVWCRRFTVNFGDVYIPNELVPPSRKVLPEFMRLAHGLRSGNITILDARTFYIPNLHYDGAGPDAYFFVGTGRGGPHSAGRKIPNEKGSLEVLQGYEGEDIELTLPSDLTVMDIDWLAVWCVAYKHNFGHVFIPKDLNVPPALGQFRQPPEHPADEKGFTNCREFLNRKVQLKWNAVGSYIHFEISARIPEDNYVALGFSRERGITKMVGADAIIVYHTPHDRKKFHADDYYMTAKSQCDGKHGVCPDSRIQGKNDVSVIDGYRKNGVTTVLFKRPFTTGESNTYDLDLDNEVNIMLAIGVLNNRKEANYHYGERTSPEDDERIMLKGKGDHTCLTTPEATQSSPQVKPWPAAIIDGVTNFTARIGPTGGKRGYTALTGQPSWGIAWYINDMLIPEIYVERGKTYYFQVEGGDNPQNPSRYHPFYITSSPEGGLGQKSEYERNQQRVFAGVQFDTERYPYATAAGRYCEWQHKTVDKSTESKTFEEYMKTLRLECDDGEPKTLTWTVDINTPDLVYYQCYTHNNLGWKIRVTDAGIRGRRTAGASSVVASSLSFSLVIVSSAILTFLQRMSIL
ncbi:unnamed protein product [Allacma fusca]|uniref:Protein Skeletor n=1 Tax=Allacma fusca TaxID=39272 RepID=A0A8J2L5M4_9HEXA|nr:unnamed protein product [Allacma fusca]